MSEILALVLQALAEAAGDLIAYFITDMIFNRVEWIKKTPWYVLAVVGALFGAFWGVLSMAVFTKHFIESPSVRIVVLVVTPFVCAGLFSLRRRFLLKRGKVVIRFERFAYVYLFTLAFLLIRHFKIQ